MTHDLTGLILTGEKPSFRSKFALLNGLVEIVTHLDAKQHVRIHRNTREVNADEVDFNGQINQNPKPNPTTILESTINMVRVICYCGLLDLYFFVM